MGAFEDFLKFRDQYGLNQLEPNQTSQNGALFTVEYLLCLLSLQEVSEDDRWSEIYRIRDQVFPQLEPALSGVPRRSPNSTEHDSMDNGIALLTFSTLFDGGEMAHRMYLHGSMTRAKRLDTNQSPDEALRFYPIAWILNGFKAPRYFWNCEDPEAFCLMGWHGRSPAYLGLLKMGAHKKDPKIKPSWFECFAVWVGQFVGLFKTKTDTDARKLPYVIWQQLKNRGVFWDMSYVVWCTILKWQYKEGMKTVYSIYYTNPTHPLRTYSKAVIL